MLRGIMEKTFKKLARDIHDEADRRQFHPKKVLLEAAQREAAVYAQEHMPDALIFERREEILDLALQRMPQEGLILEFGVSDGDSIRYLASHTNRTIHGFDSFEGLPEDWSGRHEAKGHYSTNGKLPSVSNNVVLHKGWFDATLPNFLTDQLAPVAMVHIDCDLYLSTRVVLDLLRPRIRRGTIIVFDEYFNFIGWREHEFRAFMEFVQKSNIKYHYIAWSHQQVVVVIDELP